MTTIQAKWKTDAGQQTLKEIEAKLGKYKKIVLLTTGKAYKVPIRDILTIGIKGTNLEKYPEWSNKDESN